MNITSSRFDLYLQRISYISQFGLFLITALTIYFTVIPIYQKALLDEAIAQKEIKLNEMNESLEKVYMRLRAYTVKRYVSHAIVNCLEISSFKLEFTSRSDDDSNDKKETSINRIQNTDFPDCLINTADKSDLFQDLRLEDQLVLKEKINSIVLNEELSLLKQQAIADINEVLKFSVDKIDELPPLDGFYKRFYDIFENVMSHEEFTQGVQEAKILSEQMRIEEAYRNKIIEMIRTLENLQ